MTETLTSGLRMLLIEEGKLLFSSNVTFVAGMILFNILLAYFLYNIMRQKSVNWMFVIIGAAIAIEFAIELVPPAQVVAQILGK